MPYVQLRASDHFQVEMASLHTWTFLAGNFLIQEKDALRVSISCASGGILATIRGTD